MRMGQKETVEPGPIETSGKRAELKGVSETAFRAPISPARALQTRLARELTQRASSWTWHALGLVLTVLLSTWLSAIILNAGL